MKTGKTVIAALLGKRFAAGLSAPKIEENWLGFVIEKMASAAATYDAFEKGNPYVRFVTFNFDTIIEDELNRAIRTIFRQGSFPAEHVIHVHGKLPSLPSGAIAQSDLYERFPAPWVNWVRTAASQVHVVTDDIAQDTLDAAREALSTASVVCFLGFGYNARNLKRLGLPEVIRQDPAKAMYGTAYGLMDGERFTILQHFKNLGLGDENQTSRTVLRRFPIFVE